MLSIPHLIVIFLVAFIVLGPEKLPQVARALGKTMAEFRRITGDFRNTIDSEMREMERQTQLRQEAAAVHSEFSTALEATASPTLAVPRAAEPEPAAHSPEASEGGSEPHAAAPAEPAEAQPHAASSASASPEKPGNGQSHSA
jgi:Tat protein translocase TatB subunit